MKKIKSDAKINTFLAIKNKRKDGYHNIYSTVLKIPFLYDEITIKQLSITSREVYDVKVKYIGRFARFVDKKDIITKTIRILQDKLNIGIEADIRVEKNIPVYAGLGGGSSNASLILKYMYNNYLYNIISLKELLKISSLIGSDLALFLERKQFLLILGKGNYVIPLYMCIPLYIVIVYPDIKISTSWAYSNLSNDVYDVERRKDIKVLLKQHILAFEIGIREKIVGINDFEEIEPTDDPMFV